MRWAIWSFICALVLLAWLPAASGEPRHGPTGDRGEFIRILAWGDALMDCSKPIPGCPSITWATSTILPLLSWAPGARPQGSSTDILANLLRLLIEQDPVGAAEVLRARGIAYHYADGRVLGAIAPHGVTTAEGFRGHEDILYGSKR